ncbi:hypothetical protein BDC45DRAFT_610383 [Circinella umbellata]|nr:hypothetical protein BDC45DRAFT_610383 [Circinella umbellata]
MKLVYTNKACVPLELYEQTAAYIDGLKVLGIQFPVYWFEKKKNLETNEASVNVCDSVVIYPLATEARQKLLTFSAFLVAHLGIFAFLFQVFDDRGLIMQSCCYLQLGLLILAFLLYLGTFIKDQIIIKRTIEQAIRNEQSELILQQQYRATIYCTENCDNLALDTHWMDNEINFYYYLATVLEYLFNKKTQ